MKKYIKPALKVTNIEANTILAGSGFGINSADNSYGRNDFGARGSRGSYDDEEW